MNQLDKNDNNYDRLWNMRTLFDQLTYACAKFHKQYIPKKHKCFGIKIYKLCSMTGHTNDARIYLGNDGQNAKHMITVSHATVRSLD
jgi:hypothetical protein